MEYKIILQSDFKINDKLKIQNTNNKKFLRVKIINVNFSFDCLYSQSMSTHEIIKFATISNSYELLTYKVYYTCITLKDSYYNTESLKLIEKGKIFCLDEKFVIEKGMIIL